MRRINSGYFAGQCFAIAAFLLVLSCWSFGSTGGTGMSAWKEYSVEQQTQSIVGFIHCYRTGLSDKNAFAQTDLGTVVRMVDGTLTETKDQSIGDLILDALKKAPHAKPNKYAEHWEGPYGFTDGMWWRGADNQNRQAYVQGVFWYAESASGNKITVSEKSVPATVRKLNDWYLVSDEDWKDPRSGKRADVPVVSAMQELGIISKGHAEPPTKP